MSGQLVSKTVGAPALDTHRFLYGIEGSGAASPTRMISGKWRAVRSTVVVSMGKMPI
jgi:hypothetical protein